MYRVRIYFSIAFHKLYVTYMPSFILQMRNTSLAYGYKYMQRLTILNHMYLHIMILGYTFIVVFLGMYCNVFYEYCTLGLSKFIRRDIYSRNIILLFPEKIRKKMKVAWAQLKRNWYQNAKPMKNCINQWFIAS